MKLHNFVEFTIIGLNQERAFNQLIKEFPIFQVDRQAKNKTTFKVPFLKASKVRKKLLELGFEIESEKSHGMFFYIFSALHNFGLLAAAFTMLLCYFIQSPFILQYEVIGEKNLTETEIVRYIKENFSSNKHVINTKEVETALQNNFEQLSFASVIVRGQTLIINVKEKLLPEELYGHFDPITASEDGKITAIELVSGTLNVSIGDYVKAGDVLVSPYFVDTSGQRQEVEAKAVIKMEVYYTAKVQHCESRIEIRRTGRMEKQSVITLMGLEIYRYSPKYDYKLYETEVLEENLIHNNLLPFKIKTYNVYELEEVKLEENFVDVQEKIIAQLQEKALENSVNCDTIIDEFYNITHLTGGITDVEYVVVGEKILGDK